jgi:hypothetical protein
MRSRCARGRAGPRNGAQWQRIGLGRPRSASGRGDGAGRAGRCRARVRGAGLLDPADDRFTTTIDAVRRELGHDGFISRYSTDATDDGLPGSEGQFLACSFWLVEALALNGRETEARELFERLLAVRNDLGLYAEEYDVARRRQVGNFPQAFTHLALISAARVLSGEQTGTRSAPPAPLPRMPTPPRRPARVKPMRP